MNNKYKSVLNKQGITNEDIFNGVVQYHNPKADIAEHAVSLLLGQGFSVDILRNEKPDEELNKRWKQIDRFNKFGKLLERNEYDLSYHGFKMITIEKKDGNILLTENDPNYFSKVATFQQITEISAVIYKKLVIDNITWAIKELWDDKKVVREWYKDGNRVILESLDVEIPKEFQMPEIWYHNLGILPLQLFVNKNRNITNIMEYAELSDTATSESKIKALNLYCNQQVKEAVINTTKIFGSATATQLKQLQKAYGDDAGAQLLLAQMFFNVNQPGENAPTKPVEMMQASPAFEKYILAQENILKLIWRAAGYTYLTGDESANTNADSLYSNAFDIRTTKKKKTTRQEDYAALIGKILIADKKITKEEFYNGTIEIVFNIQENSVQTPNQIVDTEIKKVEAGLKDKASALMKIENIPTKAQAETIIKDAEEDQERENEAQLKQMEAMGETEDNAGNSKFTSSMEPNGVNE